MVELKEDPPTRGERWADALTKAVGSWWFVVSQGLMLALWFTLNTVAWFWHWDSYPFILANLFMSAEAAFATPIILMSGNRTDAHVLQVLESDYRTDTDSNRLLREIANKLGVEDG